MQYLIGKVVKLGNVSQYEDVRIHFPADVFHQ